MLMSAAKNIVQPQTIKEDFVTVLLSGDKDMLIYYQQKSN